MSNNMEKLRELHDRIKDNPYRENMVLNTRYAKGYYNLLLDFVDAFNDIAREAKKNGEGQLAKLDPLLFFHDLHSAILKSRTAISRIIENDYTRYEKYKNSNPNLNLSEENDWNLIQDELLEIERGISCIHHFIDYGTFDTFYAWSRGVYMRYEWNNKNKCYEPKHIVKEYKDGNREYILKNNIFPTLEDTL